MEVLKLYFEGLSCCEISRTVGGFEGLSCEHSRGLMKGNIPNSGIFETLLKNSLRLEYLSSSNRRFLKTLLPETYLRKSESSKPKSFST
jgi:hypothetical protein